MSLINDALKRAKQTQQNQPPPNLPPLPPIEPPPVPPASPGSIRWLWPPLIIVFAVAVCFWIGLSIARHSVTKTAIEPPPVPIPPVTAVSAWVTNAPVEPAPPQRVAVVKPPAEPKLQGIAYSSTRPWAIVDGATVYVGDHVGEFRVKAILPDAVILEKADGSQKQLSMRR